MDKWIWVKIEYQKNWMVRNSTGLESVVPQVFNFEPYPNDKEYVSIYYLLLSYGEINKYLLFKMIIR